MRARCEGGEVAAAAALSLGALDAAQGREAAEVLALAFRDNPLNCAVIEDARPERRLRSNRYGMRALLPTALRSGRVLAARGREGLLGVLVSTPPLAYPLAPPPLASRLRCVWGQGLRIARRWALVFETLHAVHPGESHWYLGALGVLPEQQQRGVGSALLAHWLAQTEPDAPFHYLETDRESNVAFYRGAGFAVEGELQVLGVRVWRMRRPRRGQAG